MKGVGTPDVVTGDDDQVGWFSNDAGDGSPWTPPALSEGGIRFTSIHAGKKQRQTVLYTRCPTVFEELGEQTTYASPAESTLTDSPESAAFPPRYEE